MFVHKEENVSANDWNIDLWNQEDFDGFGNASGYENVNATGCHDKYRTGYENGMSHVVKGGGVFIGNNGEVSRRNEHQANRRASRSDRLDVERSEGHLVGHSGRTTNHDVQQDRDVRKRSCRNGNKCDVSGCSGCIIHKSKSLVEMDLIVDISLHVCICTVLMSLKKELMIRLYQRKR